MRTGWMSQYETRKHPPEWFSTAAGHETGSSVRTLLGSSSALDHRETRLAASTVWFYFDFRRQEMIKTSFAGAERTEHTIRVLWWITTKCNVVPFKAFVSHVTARTYTALALSRLHVPVLYWDLTVVHNPCLLLPSSFCYCSPGLFRPAAQTYLSSLVSSVSSVEAVYLGLVKETKHSSNSLYTDVQRNLH